MSLAQEKLGRQRIAYFTRELDLTETQQDAIINWVAMNDMLAITMLVNQTAHRIV